MQSYFLRIGSLGEVHVAKARQVYSIAVESLYEPRPGCNLDKFWGHVRSRRVPIPIATQILRITTAEDELLIRRLSRHKKQAVEQCRDALAESGSQSILLDIDQMLDGGTLIMHFLGRNRRDCRVDYEKCCRSLRVGCTNASLCEAASRRMWPRLRYRSRMRERSMQQLHSRSRLPSDCKLKYPSCGLPAYSDCMHTGWQPVLRQQKQITFFNILGAFHENRCFFFASDAVSCLPRS